MKRDLTKVPSILKPDDYVNGMILPIEKKFLLWSLEQVDKRFHDENPTFLEIGLQKAKTSKMMVQAINRIGLKSSYFGCDPNPRCGMHWNVKVMGNAGVCKPHFVNGYSAEMGDKIPEKLHWVFIDGCHCWECLYDDFRIYAPRVVPGGYVIAHDIYAATEPTAFGRRKKTQRVKCQFRQKTSIWQLERSVKMFEESEAFKRFEVVIRIFMDPRDDDRGTIVAYVAR